MTNVRIMSSIVSINVHSLSVMLCLGEDFPMQCRLLSDMSRIEAKVERLEAQLSTKEREIAAVTRTEQKSSSASKAQIEKLQQERDEFQRMVIGNQQIRTKQIHEMKKKEKEYVKLQPLGATNMVPWSLEAFGQK
eukprot:Gb_17828 [translate_table: standard]